MQQERVTLTRRQELTLYKSSEHEWFMTYPLFQASVTETAHGC